MGIHEITLNVTDRFNNSSVGRMLVIVNPAAPVDEMNPLIAVPAGGAGLALGIWLLWKRKNRR